MTVLCVCTGNTCRSPMAQVLLQRRFPHAEVISAGLAVGDTPANPYARAAMAEWELSLDHFRSQAVTQELCDRSDKIVAMSGAHAAVLQERYGVPSEKLLVWSVPDPYGGDLAWYRQTRDLLERKIRELPDDFAG